MPWLTFEMEERAQDVAGERGGGVGTEGLRGLGCEGLGSELRGCWFRGLLGRVFEGGCRVDGLEGLP